MPGCALPRPALPCPADNLTCCMELLLQCYNCYALVISSPESAARKRMQARTLHAIGTAAPFLSPPPPPTHLFSHAETTKKYWKPRQLKRACLSTLPSFFHLRPIEAIKRYYVLVEEPPYQVNKRVLVEPLYISRQKEGTRRAPVPRQPEKK